MKKLLLNYIYYNPVGHIVEALKFAKGFKDVNPDLEIHVALNKYSPTELTRACPWIKAGYAIDIYEFLHEPNDHASSLMDIPKEWDYIVTNNLIIRDTEKMDTLGRDEQAMINYYRTSDRIFGATAGNGAIFPKLALPDGLKYKPDSKVELDLPKEALTFAKRYEHNGPKFCVMLGGSGSYRSYPSIESWFTILTALTGAFPGLRIYVTGSRDKKDGRTSTGAYTEKQVQSVLSTFDNAVDCYDIGLWNQLALMKLADIFISPHTGFAFLAPCVDTPWLAISGGNWSEYFFNQVPFYSVLPDDPEFPYQCESNKYDDVDRIPSMDPKKLETKIPEIIEAAKLLMNEEFTYDRALDRNIKNIGRVNVRKERIHTKSWI